MIVFTADKKGTTDGSAYSVMQNVSSKLPIVMVSWVGDFVFNDALLGIKDYALADFMEYGWNVELTDTHIWGKNTADFGDKFSSDEWRKFDDWVAKNPPKITFKRELLKKDVTENLVPIEYPCLVLPPDVQSKEDFNNRPLSTFQYWGRSNENRLRIHGEIWHHASRKGFSVCDNIYYLNGFLQNESGEKWVSLWIPHYHRIDIKELLFYNGLSKLSLSWPGAGFKCFRSSESPINSTMVMWQNNYAWSYDWNKTNCILVEPQKELEGIDKALQREDLYDVYVAGVENCKKYKINEYIKNYIEPKISQL
jgi:hypothetical protein